MELFHYVFLISFPFAWGQGHTRKDDSHGLFRQLLDLRVPDLSFLIPDIVPEKDTFLFEICALGYCHGH
jgi:hypothetical protein